MNELEEYKKIKKYFICRNFDLIYDYIKYGVFDRSDIFVSAFKEWRSPAWPGMNVEKAYDLKKGILPTPGYLYKYKGEIYIAFRVDESNRGCSDEGIIKWGYLKAGHKKALPTPEGEEPLYIMVPLYVSNEPGPIVKGDIVYNYVYLGEKHVATFHTYPVKLKDGEISVKDNFRLDITVSYPEVTEDEVLHSIAVLFEIIDNAGKDKTSAAAPYDFYEAIKLTLGMDCSPFRFLPALGHQLMKYIVNAFDFGRSVPGNFNSDIGKFYIPRGKDGYNEIVMLLFNYAKKGYKEAKDSETKDRFRSALEVLELVFFHKAFRNRESHSQYKIHNPIRYTDLYLIDHVIFIYAMLYLFKFSLKPALQLKVDQQGDLRPTPSEQREFEELKKTDYKKLVSECLLRLRNLEAENLTEEKVRAIANNIVEKGGPDKERLEAQVKSLETHMNESVEAIKEHLQYIEDVKKLEKELQGLKEEYRSDKRKNADDHRLIGRQIEELESALGYYQEGVIKLTDRVDVIDTKIRKNWRATVVIGITVILVLPLILGFFVLPYTSWPVKTNSDFIYSFVKKSPFSSIDLPYERAEYFEEKLCEKLCVEPNLSIADYFNKIQEPEIVNLTKRITAAYRDAKDRYAKVSPSDFRYGESQYRLARMYLRGKGGEIDFDKALQHAEIADRNGYNPAKGLHSLLFLFSEELEYGSNEWRYAVENCSPPYDKLVRLIDKAASFSKGAVAPDSETLEAFMEDLGDMIINNKELSDEAYIIFSNLCENGFVRNNGNPTRYIPLLDFINITLLKAKRNDIFAQFASVNLARRLGLNDWYIYGTKHLFLNGFNEIVPFSQIWFINGLGLSEERYYEIFPEFEEIIKANPENYANLLLSFSSTYRAASKEEKNDTNDRAKSNFQYAYFLYDKAKRALPKGIMFTGGPTESQLMMKGSDSLLQDWYRNIIISPRPDQIGSFAGDVDSIKRMSAWKSYVDAYMLEKRMVSRPNREDSILKLLSYASSLGLDKARYSLALKDWEEGRDSLAIAGMKSISSRSDEACIWLAERFRRPDPDLSMKYVNMISDSLNFYKNLRIIEYKLSNNSLGLGAISTDAEYDNLNFSLISDDDIPYVQLLAFLIISAVKEGLDINQENHLEAISRQLGYMNIAVFTMAPSYGLGSVLDFINHNIAKYKDNDNNIYPAWGNEVEWLRQNIAYQTLYSGVVPYVLRDRAGLNLSWSQPDSVQSLLRNNIITEEEASRWKRCNELMIKQTNIKGLEPSEYKELEKNLPEIIGPLLWVSTIDLVPSYDFINIKP